MIKSKSQHKFNTGLGPLVAILGILPLVSRLEIVETRLSEYPWFPNMETKGDFFLYAKSKLFLILVIIMLIMTVDLILVQQKKIYFSKKYIPLFCYGGFCILSTFLAENKFISLHGMVDQYETVWVLLGYVLTTFYCYLVVQDEKDVKILLKALAFSTVVMSVLGVFQLFHMDFFETVLGKTLLIPEGLKQYRDSIMFNFSNTEFNRVYMTLYNPNYVGVYITMILPVVIMMSIACENKKMKYFLLILASLLVICMLGSGSKTGLLILLIIGITGCIFFQKRLILMKKKVMTVSLILISGIVLFNAVTGNSIYDRLKTAFGSHSRTYALEEVKPESDYIRFIYKGETYSFNSGYDQAGNLTLHLWQGDNQEINLIYQKDTDEFVADIEEIAEFTFQTYEKDQIVYVIMKYKNIPWRFTNSLGDGNYQYISMNGKIDTIEKADVVLFHGYETILTYRGYTWGRTLPLLKDYIFYGAGPDQFALVFPQNDYVMRSNMSYGFFTEILTKPHNLYLQIATQTGVLSLACFLAFCIMYLVQSFQLYFGKDSYGYLEQMGVGISLGVTGYLLCGITNDSCVAVAPVFWVLIGLGMVVNKRNSLNQ